MNGGLRSIQEWVYKSLEQMNDQWRSLFDKQVDQMIFMF